jgi:hypothetical protein
LGIRTAVAGLAAVVVAVSVVGPATGAVTPAAPPAGTIDTAASPSTAFSGTVAGTVAGGAECADPVAAGTCSYFELETVDAGLIEVSIAWPAPADPAFESNLDLEVWECLGGCRQVAVSAQDRGAEETVQFQAAAGATYEVRVVPFFVPTPESYEGTAGYVGAEPPAQPAGVRISVLGVDIALSVNADVSINLLSGRSG